MAELQKYLELVNKFSIFDFEYSIITFYFVRLFCKQENKGHTIASLWFCIIRTCCTVRLLLLGEKHAFRILEIK